MLRLTQSWTKTLATVDLDGKLCGPWVDEVRTTVAGLTSEAPVCLNLQQLSFADAAGIDLLCTLSREGVRLVAASPLIDGLLKAHRDRAVETLHAGEFD